MTSSPAYSPSQYSEATEAMNALQTILKALFACAVLLATTDAMAHAMLEAAEPKVGSVVDKPPEEVVLTFSEKLEPDFSQVKVVSSDAQDVELGKATVDAKSANVLRVKVGKLTPGTYTVKWSVTSVDSHQTRGEFTFRVSP
jgi:methionine-rich copper-binding protein CopC